VQSAVEVYEQVPEEERLRLEKEQEREAEVSVECDEGLLCVVRRWE
jgi:hypothetical protein